MAVSLSRLLCGALLPAAALFAAAPLAAQVQAPTTALEPVTVTATKTERAPENVPASIDIVGPEEIERRAPAKVDDLIRDIPGVDMSGGPRRSGQDINIRGFGGQRVVTTIDGARQDFEAGHKGRIFIDPDLLKQVEVLKGPASALHGSGAVGGVLALTTKDASDYLEGDEKFALRGKTGYRTVAREPMFSATHVGRPIKEFDYLANVTYRYGGNILQGNGKELGSSAEDMHNGLFKVGINPADNHRIGVSHQFSKETGHMPNLADDQVTSSAPLVRRRIERETNSLRYNYKNPEGGLINPTFVTYENRITVYDDRLPPATARRDITGLRTVGFDVYNTSNFDLGFTDHALTYGVEYYRGTASAYRNGALRPEFPRGSQDVAGYYVQDEIKLGAFSIVPGLRYDVAHAQASGIERNDERVSPRLGGLWRITEWATPYVSYAQGFRAPTLLERFVGGSHIPGQVVFLSNPDLKPEETETYEIGSRFKFDNVLTDRDRLRLSASYFRTTADNFIELTGAAPPSSGARYVNIAQVDVDGVESQVTWDNPRAFAGAGIARIRGTNTSTGSGVNSVPPDKLSLTAGLKAPALDLLYGIRSELAAPQTRVSSDGTPTAGYHVHGLFASWQPSDERLRGFRIDGGIDNIFDKTYRRHLSLLNEEGRDFYGAVSYTVKF